MTNPMKIKLHIFYLLICLICINCKSKDSDSSAVLPKISIDLDHIQSVSYPDLFSGIELIPLETTDSNLLGIIYPIFTEDYYLMRDNTQQQVAAFDKNGKLKYKIANHGAAPNQYRYLTELRLNPFSTNMLLIETPNYIHEYDLDGTFLKKTRIDSINNIEDIIPINKDSLIIVGKDKLTDYYYFYSSKQNRILSHIKDSTYHQAAYKFFRKGNHLFSYRWFGNIIYKIKNQDFKPSYILDFGKYNHRLKNYSNLFQYMYENRYNEKSDKAIIENFNYVILNIQENKKYLLITIEQIKNNSTDTQTLNILYNKKSKTSSLIDLDKNHLIWNQWGDKITENYYITHISASEKESIDTNLLDNNCKKILHQVDENDNPIILKYKFK